MPEHVSITYDHPGNCPICGMALVPVTPGELKQLQPGGKVLYYTCPMPEHASVHEDKPGKCPICGMTLDSRDGAAGRSHESSPQSKPAKSSVGEHQFLQQPAAKQLYTCPMHPDVISDKPGKCPKCGMDLVPWKNDKHESTDCSALLRRERSTAHSQNMLQRIIDFSLKNKFIVLLVTVVLVLGGVYAVRNIPLDAIPDLSDTQVIIYTPWEGQAPNIVEDQVTYPITTKMLSVPRAKVVRGYSFYGYSFVYVIFDDGTDPYWARSRVLEYLSSISGQLPKGVTPSLGPDATGVGWAFMYSINSTNRNLADLRSIQDWYLKYQLTAVPGVSEVASIGGFVKQYQVTVDPTKLRAYNLSLSEVSQAIERSNGEVGGRSLELSEREFILRVKGYIENLDDLKKVAVGVGENGVPILLRDVANIQFGPDMRRGIADLNGDGETVGGIVVVRYGANASRSSRT